MSWGARRTIINVQRIVSLFLVDILASAFCRFCK